MQTGVRQRCKESLLATLPRIAQVFPRLLEFSRPTGGQGVLPSRTFEFSLRFPFSDGHFL